MSDSPPTQQPVEFVLWDSGSELAEHLRQSGKQVTTVGEVASAEQWALAKVNGVPVALALERAEQVPHVARTNANAPAVIGVNDGLVGIDLEQGLVAFDIRFGSPFYEFVTVGPERLIALFETGLVSVASEGAELWRVDTDLIVDWESRGEDELLLTFSDGTSRSLELCTGRFKR